MSRCLYAYNNPNYSDVVGSGWQAAQYRQFLSANLHR